MGHEIDVFDKTSLFDREVAPKLEEISNLCTMLGIPFFWTACVKSEPEKTEYRHQGFLTGSHGIHLFDDQIIKHLKVVRGFVPQLPMLDLNMGTPDGMPLIPPSIDDDDEGIDSED